MRLWSSSVTTAQEKLQRLTCWLVLLSLLQDLLLSTILRASLLTCLLTTDTSLTSSDSVPKLMCSSRKWQWGKIWYSIASLKTSVTWNRWLTKRLTSSTLQRSRQLLRAVFLEARKGNYSSQSLFWAIQKSFFWTSLHREWIQQRVAKLGKS